MDFLDSLKMPEWLAYTIAGTVILLFIWWKFSKAILFPFRSKKVEGVITNWMAMTEKGSRYFYPLIEFTTLKGEVIKMRAEERCEGKPLYEPGTKVVVAYDENEPKFVKIKYP